MKSVNKHKIILLLVFFMFVFFFSSDFGLIDVEKTSIITAIAVDRVDDEYLITAQVAVPEANDTNTENKKAQISARGTTVGGAIKKLGEISGWYPKLAFCNLIMLGENFDNENVVNVLDFFAKTLRVQDSALVCMTKGSAHEVLSSTTPLDNISSFALQKIMFKNPCHDKAICSIDLKTFFEGHYSPSESSFMPFIKMIPANAEKKEIPPDEQDTQNKGNKNASENNNKDKSTFFDASTTVLFNKGMKVGELDEMETLVFNGFTSAFVGANISVNDVENEGVKSNYLLNVMKNDSKITVNASNNDFIVNLNMSIYCKVIDVNKDGTMDALAQNIPIPNPVKMKAQLLLTDYIKSMVNKSVVSKCDFMDLKQKLYRFNHKQYSRYKDNFLSVLKTNINVDVHGQR